MPATQLLAKPAPHKRQQIVESLRNLAETMAPGERLPSLSDLTRQFGVAPGTVKAALEVLRKEGQVESRHGSGTFVAHRPISARLPGNGNGTKASTGTLAVMAPWQNPFFRHCVDELAAQAEKKGLQVVCHFNKGMTDLEGAFSLEALHPEGYVLFNYAFAPAAEAMIARGYRAVVVGVPPPGVVPTVPCVYGDHDRGGALAAERLLKLGHRRIAFVDEFTMTNLRKMRRWQSFVQALREAGIVDAERVITAAAWHSWRDDLESLRRYFDAPDAPTALAVWSDATAVEILHLLRQGGLRVPEDISVIGYDNLPMSEHSHPTLDTVDAHIEVQIRQALDLLMAPLRPGVISTAVVTPHLLCRASCARSRD
jgi:DNA-binding LacI/PurR family transcriptional regulator